MRKLTLLLPLIASLAISQQTFAQNNDGSGRTSGAEHLDSKGQKPEQKSKALIGGGAAKQLIGAPVQGSGDKPIGKVESVCLVDGEVYQLIVVMPKGQQAQEHRFALPFTESSVRTDKQPLVKVNKSAEEVRKQPAYQYRSQNQVGKVFGSADASSAAEKVASADNEPGTCNTK